MSRNRNLSLLVTALIFLYLADGMSLLNAQRRPLLEGELNIIVDDAGTTAISVQATGNL